MKNQIVRCKCVDMSIDGLGICKLDGLVIFVKGMIIDEVADVKIILEKKNYSIGIIDKLIEKSIHRIETDCHISYKCGGCDFRYIDYNYQLKLKKDILESIFKDYQVEDIIKDDNPYYYRNKIQIPLKDNKMGFYRKNSNDIVEFEDCLIESEIANEIITDLKIQLNDNQRKYIRHILIKHSKTTKEVMIGFIVNSFDINMDNIVSFLVNKYSEIKSIILNLNDKKTNVILGDKEKLLYGLDYIYDEYDGIKVKISLKSFYQVNYDQMLKLYSLVKDLSLVDNKKSVLDLYCGIGTISLYLSRYAKSVIGVEIVDAAIKNAKDNAKINNINNASFILADARKDMDEYLMNKDIVILDPPRKGISEQLITSIKNSNVDKIVYVSCNPLTLNRDLKLLEDKYNIGKIYPVDLFPFTIHCECVVALDRR